MRLVFFRWRYNELIVNAQTLKICMHIAAALKPELVMLKPDMDVDSGCMICKNEIQRIKALV